MSIFTDIYNVYYIIFWPSLSHYKTAICASKLSHTKLIYKAKYFALQFAHQCPHWLPKDIYLCAFQINIWHVITSGEIDRRAITKCPALVNFMTTITEEP